MARASVFLAKHLKNPVFSTSLSILLSGRCRCLVITDVMLSSVLPQSPNCNPTAPVLDGLSKRSPVRCHSTAAVSCSLSPHRTFFHRLPLASSYGLLLPHFQHQKEVSIVSTQETTLVGRISDVVRLGHGSDFVA
jgi:hypothetical protein